MTIDLTQSEIKDIQSVLLTEMRRTQDYMASVAILPADDALFAALNERIKRLDAIYSKLIGSIADQ